MNIFDRIFKEKVKLKSLSTYFGLSRNGKLNWNTTECLEAYEINSYVFACIDKRAEKVGSIEFKLERNDEEVEKDAIINLLYKPNDYQVKEQFFKEWQTFKDLTGLAIIRKERGSELSTKVKALHNLNPRFITLQNTDFDEYGRITKLHYANPYTNSNEEILAKDLIISMRKGLINPLRPFSLIMAGAIIIDTAKQLGIYQNNVLKNGGKIEGILSFTDELDDAQREQIKKEFEKNYAGSENAGKPLLLEGGATYQNLGLTPTELGYATSIGLSKSDILMITGVPKAIVAQTDDVNYANAKTAKDIFLSETIKPLLKELVNVLNEDLELVPKEYELTFEDPTPEDIELKLKQIDNGKNNGYLTINEMRDLAGYDELPNGDVILVPFGLQPIEEAVAPTMELRMKSFNHPFKNKVFRTNYFNMYKSVMDKYNVKFLREIKNIFKEQKNYLVGKLRIDSKSFSMKKSIIDDIFNESLQITITKEALLPLIENIFKTAGTDAFKTFNYDKTFRINPNYKNQIIKRAENIAGWINETTKNKLNDIFNNSVNNNETILELADRIENEFTDISSGRAKTIARTETSTAWNNGRFDAYEEMHIPIKIWVHTDASENPREEHIEMDGEERPMNVPFSNGLQYPCDPMGDPGETINCNCTW